MDWCPGQRRLVWSWSDADVCRATAADHKLIGARVPAQPDFEGAFPNPVAPLGKEFARLQAGGFADWLLVLDGMIARPISFSLSDLKHLPVRRQITEVACEEGWSYIAEWVGTPLVEVLNAAGVLPQARYVVYYSFDGEWWDSLDMADALHPQTLLTWAMNDGALPVSFGGHCACACRANWATRA